MNILILTGSFGMGHNSAANAVAERIRTELNDSKIYVEDLFSETLKSKTYSFPFRMMVKHGKFLYNFVYRHTENSILFQKLPFHTYLLRILRELIQKSNADLIVSTLPFCSKVVSDYKQSSGSTIPLITCITDVSSHSEWIQSNTDFYLVAAPKLKDELTRKGVAPQRIMVSGIPVRGAFQAEGAETAQAKEKRILMMGGGLGLLPRSKSFYEEINRLDGVKTTVITGNNTRLYNALTEKYENIEVLAYTNDVPSYMKRADLLISKPGGITVFEAISAKLPLLMFPPFLQQEMKNGRFLLENSLGDTLPDDRSAWIDKIRAVLDDDEMRGHMKENMRRFQSCLEEDALLRAIHPYGLQCV